VGRLRRWWSAIARVPKLGAVAVLIVAAVAAAVLFAIAGPAGRASAVASALAAVAATTAALAAIYLSREALARTDQQLSAAERATILSRYPLLLPIHQSVAFPESGGNIAPHPPTHDRFRLDSESLGSYAFVADTKDRFIIPVENVGEGPALRISGRLWRSDGALGDVVGPSALGAGRVAIMTARLQDEQETLPGAFEEAIKATGEPQGGPYYWLDLSYADVFENALGACALFDPRGLGAWRHHYGPRIEPTTRRHLPWVSTDPRASANMAAVGESWMFLGVHG
jgi:type II secretory pathway pseudopilin PulG